MKLRIEIVTKFLLTLFFSFSILTSLSIFPNFFVKWYHIFGLLLFATILILGGSKINVKYLPQSILFFFLAVMIYSILGTIFFRPNQLIINYSFAFLVFITGINIHNFVAKTTINNCLVISSVFAFSMIILKNIIYRDVLFKFILNPYNHPILPWLISGGPNIEASIIIMNNVFFMKRRKLFYISLIVSIIISIVYASRTAIVLAILVYGLYIISDFSGKNEKRFFYILVMLFPFVLLFSGIGIGILDNLYVLKRFTEIGNEAGSLGRIALWENILNASSKNYFQGYGAGNAIYAISQRTTTFTENNVHNIYLQILLDFGIIGLIFYLVFNFEVFIHFFKYKRKSPLLFWIILYFAASLLQFRGSDAIFWFLIGCFYAEKRMYSTNSTF